MVNFDHIFDMLLTNNLQMSVRHLYSGFVKWKWIESEFCITFCNEMKSSLIRYCHRLARPAPTSSDMQLMAIRSPGLPCSGRHPRNPCNYIDYYSFTNPGGMEGRVGLGLIRHSLDVESVKTLFHSFVSSRVDYCNSVLVSAPKKATDELQRVQNVAAHNCRRNTETQALSFTAVAWWPALADYSTARAVQACRDCSSVSLVPSSKVPRRLLLASLRSFQSPASPFGQPSQTEYSAVSSQYF